MVNKITVIIKKQIIEQFEPARLMWITEKLSTSNSQIIYVNDNLLIY